MTKLAVLSVLSLLIGGVALLATPVQAAGWISGAESYAAPWVREIEHELLKKDYWNVFVNDPRAPQKSVLQFLNRAAVAYEAKDMALAEEFVREAIGVLEDGVRKHYFTQADVAPIETYIRQHVPVKTS